MHTSYQGVTTRFLREDERLILSQENEMPLVIEATDSADLAFLKEFLATNSQQLIKDMAQYGAVLLRGFHINTDEDFEKTILSIPEFRGISDVFMSENGRVHVDDLQFVLHTNSVYKTGGTVYLGGFHTENYYSVDVPGYLFFCCFQPSILGGETGLINTQKIYTTLSDELKQKLEQNSFFVTKWSVSEIATRYQISQDTVKKTCKKFNLLIAGEPDKEFVLMYKPSVWEHPVTQEKALQINLLELKTLNHELRKYFIKDYQGKTWFWHRFFWKLPYSIFTAIESIAVAFIAFFHSPKNSCRIMRTKLSHLITSRKNKNIFENTLSVGTCFTKQDVKELASHMRNYYSSCLWKKGDVLLIDNKKVMHAGMPGMGPRLIRAMIANPLEIDCSSSPSGIIKVKERTSDTLGACINRLNTN